MSGASGFCDVRVLRKNNGYPNNELFGVALEERNVKRVIVVCTVDHGKLNTWKRRLRAFSANTFLLIF
jgi:hypothetical protein